MAHEFWIEIVGLPRQTYTNMSEEKRRFMPKTQAYGEQIWDENRRLAPTGVYEYVGGGIGGLCQKPKPMAHEFWIEIVGLPRQAYMNTSEGETAIYAKIRKPLVENVAFFVEFYIIIRKYTLCSAYSRKHLKSAIY
jgi:hypothetical protein